MKTIEDPIDMDKVRRHWHPFQNPNLLINHWANGVQLPYFHDLFNDVFVDELFNGKQSGYFVEIGALDGIMNSTSYFFEKFRNWNGIVVEPHPGWYNTCTSDIDCQKDHLFDYFTQVCRAGKQLVSIQYNRKNVSRKAISDVNGTQKFICTLNPAFSGIKNESKQDPENLKLEKEVELQTCTLTQLLDEYNAPKTIDYISLDVEGAELKILKKFFADNKYIVKVISLESDKLMDSVELMFHQQNFIKLDNHYVENVRQNKKTYELELVGRNPDILVTGEYRRVYWEHFYINREFIRI